MTAMTRAHRVALALVSCCVALCPAGSRAGSPQVPSDAAVPAAFDMRAWLEHVRQLSSDAFEGRAPGTKGEEATVAYLVEQFKRIGLAPAGRDGSFIEPVPLVGITATHEPLVFRRADRSLALQPKDDFVAWTKRHVAEATLQDSELVFVGYGVEAPEAQWDDFKGVDLAGKTMVVLIGDPPVPDPADPGRLDPKVFGGPAMTYYGRWVYKLDAGAARRAAGVLIVHETATAGYGFSVVQGRLGELFDLRAADDNVGRPAVEGWLTIEKARELFARSGRDFDALKREAATRAFRPVALGVTASTRIRNQLRQVDSRNVAGRLEGSDPTLKGEHVVFTAHWDHFGVGTPIDGQTIRHGALDNATGVAGLLEMARVFAAAPVRPPRSLLFLSITAEEQLLLGSEHYVRQPLVPLEKTLAVLNFEMMNVYGRTSDLTVYGLGASELDDDLSEAAKRQGRAVRPDPAPEAGWYYRSDHFPFARQGVPALWAGGGDRFVGKPADHGTRMRDEYTANRYHKPLDIVRPEWEMEGVADDLQIYYDVAWRVARAARWPEWKPGAEFKAKRDRMLGR
jgi:Zn-dependent M28 family amino/carboxypeptidase